MSLGSLKDLYLDDLRDLYAAETQMIRALPRLVDEARAPELRDLLSKHCEESRLHVERLQLIFTHWGQRVPSSTCAAIAGIVQEADERLNQLTTDDVRDAAIIGIAQRIEHYEIAVYGCARTYALRLSRNDDARLLQETLDEEGRADHRLTEIAEAHINDDARSETDLAAPARVRRFWITVTPGLAERLSDEARSFANEFAPVSNAGAEPAPRNVSADSPEVEVAGPALDVAGPSASTPHRPELVESPLSERVVASEEVPDETITPPHGDKLRTRV